MTTIPVVLIQWLGVVSVFVFAADLGRVAGSFSWPWAWLASAVLYLVASRLILRWAVELWQADGRLAVGCAIVGSGALAQRLRDQQPVGVRVVGILAVDQLGTLKRAVQSDQVQRIIVALPTTTAADVSDVLYELNALPVDLLLYPPNSTDNPTAAQPLPTSGEIPLLKMRGRPLDDTDLFLKRAEDIALATLALVIVAPLLPLIAIAIKLDSVGPIIFQQNRRGRAGIIFKVLKFRTLYIEQTDSRRQAASSRSRWRRDPGSASPARASSK